MGSPSSKSSPQGHGERNEGAENGTSLHDDLSAEAEAKTSKRSLTQDEIDNAWVDCYDDNGNKYKYNSLTEESVWAEVEEGKDAKAEEVSFVDSLKMKHQASLKTLRDNLGNAKAKKLRLLEDRLMRRQQLRKKTGEVDHGEDKELEQEIYETGREHDQMIETIVSGYKKKCLYEMKVNFHFKKLYMSISISVCIY